MSTKQTKGKGKPSKTFCANPHIFEIHTWVWLDALHTKYGKSITLASVPLKEWEDLAAIGVDAVWLMGVWERSPEGKRIALEHDGLQKEFRHALPDFAASDVVGSPYSIHKYGIDKYFGGEEELKQVRQILRSMGIALILDFVPNHVALDHPWIQEHPEYFIQGNPGDLKNCPTGFFQSENAIIALGKDPYFPAWTDTAQLNIFNTGLRNAVLETLIHIAELCDGIRCDMAMLPVTRIFSKTWGDRSGDPPEEEFWTSIIPGVRKTNPNFLFIAEAYWDMEWDLQQQGFDYCYDKRLYDRLLEGSAEGIVTHIRADKSFQQKLVRFIENHDEPRSATSFHPDRLRLAALLSTTLPGATLFYQGQFEGYTRKLPVQLGRQTVEEPDSELQRFYHALISETQNPVYKKGEWTLCERGGWAGNTQCNDLLSWAWTEGENRRLVVLNYSEKKTHGRVPLPWDQMSEKSWLLRDVLSGEEYSRDGTELSDSGLYVDLNPWGFHLFDVCSVGS